MKTSTRSLLRQSLAKTDVEAKVRVIYLCPPVERDSLLSTYQSQIFLETVDLFKRVQQRTVGHVPSAQMLLETVDSL